MEKPLLLEEIQKVNLETLKFISRICDREGIRYILAYGTLIGAIRHKGFIPWDDDLDIMIPRPDYERLLNYFDEHKDELLPYSAMNMQNTPGYPHMITRICDTRYRIDVDNEDDCGMGLFVDCVCMDGCGNSLKEANCIMNNTKRYCHLIFLSQRKRLEVKTAKGIKRKFLKPFAYFYAKLVGTKALVNKLLSIIDVSSYQNSKYVSCLIWPTYFNREIIKKEFLEDRILVEFEDAKFFAPRDYDAYLRQLYGDYMTPPPENDRIYHHFYTAYRKN